MKQYMVVLLNKLYLHNKDYLFYGLFKKYFPLLEKYSDITEKDKNIRDVHIKRNDNLLNRFSMNKYRNIARIIANPALLICHAKIIEREVRRR